MKKEDMSCIDCAVKNCNKMDKTYPDFLSDNTHG